LEHYIYAGRDVHKIVNAGGEFISQGFVPDADLELRYLKRIIGIRMLGMLPGASKKKSVKPRAFHLFNGKEPERQPHSAVNVVGPPAVVGREVLRPGLSP